jgi:hypothetical protein
MVDSKQEALFRLRAERKEIEEQEQQEAAAAGADWALQAEFAELKRVVATDTSLWNHSDPRATGWSALLADAVFGEGEWDRTMAEELCESAFGTAYPGKHQVEAFIEGASEVFAEV